MAAHADDERYFYAEDLGATIELTLAGAGASEELRAEPLEPGRYMLRVVAWGGCTQLWVRQGAAGDVTAAAQAPSTRFNPPTDVGFTNAPLVTFMVRPGTRDGKPASDMLAFWGVTAVCTVQVTKISRDRS